MQQFGPEWLKPAFDHRFNELVRQAGMQREIDQLQNRHRELENLLKSELSQAQYELYLEMEEIINYRNTLIIQQLYFAGLKDGVQLLRELL
ncbi:hypothetical protein U9M73_01795 [Paenibacillus phoenicis]|uniref:Uncharacterized protein n=1 Tax=Paenibacillus phoenicis TaxID=554117 RepID=A0ABU5PFQ8_9BACL|nr:MULTISPECIES: hypothetical protein [Paenibacillus]EES72070.1 hypothetical protein POTG_03385 [Paenibacillus sp. oral taxon 786 str. D14]MCT2193724.1 hypothetical protein [Paenibacillus sp. p3-SID1389]MEA3568731.1 hypothetical protein [Paenibacillus phoenicis]